MISKLGILIPFILSNLSYAQKTPEAGETLFKKGDQLSATCFTSILNSNDSKICISELKGRSILLFSWSILCGNYPSLFKKIDSLQTEFNGNIQILMVNRESVSKTKEFFEKRPRLVKPNVPIIAGDAVLNKIFPDRGYVPCVIIDKYGMLEYFINDYNISGKLITAYLSGRSLEAKEPINSLPKNESQFIQFQSYLSRCNPALNVGYTDGKIIENSKALVAYNCVPIIELVRKAYEQNGKYDFSKLSLCEVHIKNPDSFFRPTDMTLYDDWVRKHSYSYSLKIPENRYSDRFNLMQEDIKRYFSISVKIENKPVNCWVLKESNTRHILCTKGGSPEDSLLVHSIADPGIAPTPLMRNQPYSKFIHRIKYLIEQSTNMPFINKLSVDCNIDIKFNKEVFDERLHMDLLSKELLQYNIILQKAQIERPVLIISDKQRS